MARAGHQATIVSTDKGYCQLLAPDIRIRDYFQKRWLDLPFIETEFGVAPTVLPDYWGLCGISSSKIPVSRASAPKRPGTAAAVRLTGIALPTVDQVPTKWRNKLQTEQEMAFISRDVARLKQDLVLEGNLNLLRYSGD